MQSCRRDAGKPGPLAEPSKDGAAVLMSGARHNHCIPEDGVGRVRRPKGKTVRFKARVHEVA